MNRQTRIALLVALGLLAALVLLSALCDAPKADERFPVSLLDEYGQPVTAALIVAYATGDTTPVDTAYEQGDGMYWFQVDSDSGFTSGYYDVYINGSLGDAWTGVYLGMGNVPALNSVDSTRVIDYGLSGNDIADDAIGTRHMAHSQIVIDTLRVSYYATLVEGILGDDWTIGDAASDTVWLNGTFEATNTNQSEKFRLWQRRQGAQMFNARIKSGRLFYCSLDTTGTHSDYAQFLNCYIPDFVDNPSAGAFFVDNNSDSCAGSTTWNRGANCGLYSLNYHTGGTGIRAWSCRNTAQEVEVTETGDGIYLTPYASTTGTDSVWGGANLIYCNVEDSTRGVYIDMDGGGTYGMKITRDGCDLAGAALEIDNNDGGYRTIDVDDSETGSGHSVLSIRHAGAASPYTSGAPWHYADSALVDVRVGPVSSGTSGHFSGIRFQGMSFGGRPAVRIRDTGNTGNGGALIVDTKNSQSGNGILAKVRGGVLWTSGLYARTAWYDTAAVDSLQWAGLDSIPYGCDCDTLVIGNVGVMDLFFLERRWPAPVMGGQNGDLFASINADSEWVVVCREDTATLDAALYSWHRMRHNGGME